ncbi:MAG: M42 family metallopeptidase [Desulfobacteraceae bacterium]|nr:M42 family metallopeptidase [Desulfobacteraceae bacterium]
MDRTEQLLKELSEAHGIPGYEAEIRAVVRRHLEPLGRMDRDNVGSIACTQDGSGPRVMLAAHLDEVGLMVNHIAEQGVLRFIPLGGWWGPVLLGQRVLVKTNRGDLPGVIGAKPPHLLTDDERKKPVEAKSMYIDIGASAREQAESAGVRIGDPVVPDASFVPILGGSAYIGKAFDDRVGLALVIEAMSHFARTPHPNVLVGAATTMEEVGLRGAKTCAELVRPDAAIVLEIDFCGDVPGIKPEESSTKLGGGPALVLLESKMISNLAFRDLVVDTAKELGIPLQYSAWTGGSTDGGRIHLHGTGVPTIVLGVPARHIHSHHGIINRQDYDRTLKLLTALVASLDSDVVEGFTRV